MTFLSKVRGWFRKEIEPSTPVRPTIFELDSLVSQGQCVRVSRRVCDNYEYPGATRYYCRQDYFIVSLGRPLDTIVADIAKLEAVLKEYDETMAQFNAFKALVGDITNPLDIVRFYASYIQNGRTIADAARHAGLELVELQEEIDKKERGEVAGPDGVIGEAIDVLACALDIIFVEAPNMSNAHIAEILFSKCNKWARRYKDSVDGDRSID